MVMPKLGGLVLAGGGSRRMGLDKAALELGGLSFLDRAIALLQAAGAEDLRIAGRPDLPGGLADAEPGGGPARALLGALDGLPVHLDPVLVVPVDMPLLQAGDLVALLGAGEAAAWADHPLPMCLSRRALAGIGADRPVSMHGLLRAVAAERPVAEPERARRFANINRPEDFQCLLREQMP
jgi:molybdenum cofactor guanylyltransferase